MQIVDRAAVDPDFAGGDRLQSGNGVEQRGLAAAGRADQHQEAALLQIEVDPLEDLDLAEALPQTINFKKSHRVIL
jgi:hypothetical protein